MANASSGPAANTAPHGRLPLFLIGLLLFILGPAIVFLQVSAGVLTVPWHAPILATIGLLFMFASVVRRPGVIRIAVLVLLLLVCGFEWFIVLGGAKTPPYQGPAQVGRPLPAFATTLADGTSFTNKSLENGQSSVIVFFRGRW